MTTEPTLKEVSESIRRRLAPHYGEGEASAMARIVVEELLHYDAVDAVLRKDTTISSFMCGKVDKVVDRLLDDEPIQYVFGKARFYGADIKVNPSVLIPRPETEELVDMIVKQWGDKTDLKVLDLCTGSGCIAVTLARVLKFAEVEGVDLSSEALEVAAENARDAHVKVAWSRMDVLKMTARDEAEYDIIVSNPPYVLESEKASMDRNVLCYEPGMALFVPDSDPLKFYKPISKFASKALKPSGQLFFEINPLCAAAVTDMLKKMGFNDIEVVPDMYGKRRFVTAFSPAYGD